MTVRDIEAAPTTNHVPGAEVSFNSQTLAYATFSDKAFDNVDFGAADFRLARFNRCDFIDCNFEEADFQLAQFENCSFVNNETNQQKTGNLSSTYWLNCDFYVDGTWAWPFISLRSAAFEKCRFGRISFESTTIEECRFSECEFEEMSAIFGIVSRAQFQKCKFKRVKFSLATFFSAYGSAELLAAQDIVSLHDSSVDRQELSRGKENVVNQLTEFLGNNSSRIPLSYTINGIYEIAAFNDNSKLIRERILSTVIDYLNDSSIDLLQKIDEIEKTIGFFIYHEILDSRFYFGCLELSQALSSVSIYVPDKLRNQFDNRLKEYGSKTQPQFLVKFVFSGLSYRDQTDVLRAMDWVMEVSKLDDRLSANNISISNGSITLEMLVGLLEANTWYAILCGWLLFKIDPHRLFDQITETIRNRGSQKNVEMITQKIDEYGIHVIIEETDFILLKRGDKVRLSAIEKAATSGQIQLLD